MNDPSREEINGWYILELMGHRKLAGFLTEVTIAGAPMLRLDIPGTADARDGTVNTTPVTQYYSAAAVYCMTPTTEDLARGLAETKRPTPVSQFELPAPRPRITRDVNPGTPDHTFEPRDDYGYDDEDNERP